MIAVMNIWNLGLALVIAIPCVLMVCFVAFLLHRDSMQQTVRFSFPRFIPWSVAAKTRRVRAEVELSQAQHDLHDQKHKTLQKQMVLRDLENEEFKRALGSGNE